MAFKLFSSGFGSRWKSQEKQCPECGSTDLIYLDKFYAECRRCGKLLSRSVLRRQ